MYVQFFSFSVPQLVIFGLNWLDLRRDSVIVFSDPQSTGYYFGRCLAAVDTGAKGTSL